MFRRLVGGHSRQLIPFLKEAADAGEPFEFVRKGYYGTVAADHGLFWGVSGFSVDDPHKLEKYGIIGGIMGLQNPDGESFQDIYARSKVSMRYSSVRMISSTAWVFPRNTKIRFS